MVPGAPWADPQAKESLPRPCVVHLVKASIFFSVLAGYRR
jgi:hypothetical protein